MSQLLAALIWKLDNVSLSLEFYGSVGFAE